jgi:hypothetical protein
MLRNYGDIASNTRRRLTKGLLHTLDEFCEKFDVR